MKGVGTTVIIPIDKRTGKPRKGKWVNRCWIPDVPEPFVPTPQSNPNFDPSSRLGKLASQKGVRHG